MPINFDSTFAFTPADFWLWVERISVIIAGSASLIAVILGGQAIRLARNERQSRERSQAALVLNVAHLIRRRMEGMWKTSVVAATVWPAEHEFDYWLTLSKRESEHATRLLDRAAAVSLEAANYAEIAWRYTDQLRHWLGEARAAREHEMSVHGSPLPRAVERIWMSHRERVAGAVEGVLLALDRIDAIFPEDARLVEGVPSVDHLLETDKRIREEAMLRAKRIVSERAEPT